MNPSYLQANKKHGFAFFLNKIFFIVSPCVASSFSDYPIINCEMKIYKEKGNEKEVWKMIVKKC